MYGKILIILTFYITREKQPVPQGACINITIISDIEIWDTYIENIFLIAIVQNSHLAPSALFQCCYMHGSEKLALCMSRIRACMPRATRARSNLGFNTGRRQKSKNCRNFGLENQN